MGLESRAVEEKLPPNPLMKLGILDHPDQDGPFIFFKVMHECRDDINGRQKEGRRGFPTAISARFAEGTENGMPARDTLPRVAPSV